MDLSCGPPPLLPIPQAAPRLPLLPKRARATAIPAVRSDGFSNARGVFVDVGRSIQNVFGISQLCRPILQFPCSPKPPCAALEDASRHAALPATAWPAIAAPDGRRLRDPLCSRQICRQSPSARLSYSECRRQDPVQAPPARSRQAARCRFHPGRRRPFRSARASFQLRPTATPLPLSLARGRREILVSPSSG